MVLITLIKTPNNHEAFSSTTEVTAKVYVLKAPAEREYEILQQRYLRGNCHKHLWFGTTHPTASFPDYELLKDRQLNFFPEFLPPGTVPGTTKFSINFPMSE